jgi:hypothetical protein
VEVSDEDAPLVIAALEHLAAYRKAVQRDDRPYLELADKLRRKPPASETGKPVRSKKTG